MNFFYVYFSVFIFFFNTISAKDAIKDLTSNIEKIPLEDRKKLEQFFCDLVVSNHFGYTLYGDKPISLAGYFCKTPLENIACGQLSFDNFPQLLSTWKKHASKFPSKKFLLIDEPQTNPDLREFVIINKPALIKTINKNIDYFKQILGDHISVKKILKKLQQPNANLHTILHNHEGLLGILLGYGTRNAILYHQRDNILQDMRMEKIPLNLHTPLTLLSNNDKLERELKYLWAHLKSCGEHTFSLPIIGSVHFVGDLSSPETIALITKYKDMRGHLSSLYADGCFLHRTLMQLISE